MRLDKLTKTVVAALDDIKGRDITVLDVRKMTSLFDRIVIASADSTRQSKALSSHLQQKVRTLGARVHSVEGERTGEWVLVDLGSVVVHIMLSATRRHFNLEELWAPPPRARRRRATAPAAR